MVDWASVRAEFPALANWTFLNTATFGQLSRRSTEAVNRYFARRDETACHDFLTWYDDADRVRESIARLIHCTADDVAFIPTASAGLALLMNGMEWRPGDRVVTLTDEFPNQLYWPAVLAERGVEFVETPWERFHDVVTPSTRLVLLSTVNYANGFRPPMEDVARFVHGCGARLFVDATQSAGALALDMATLQPDMLAVHGYKWMLTPEGVGFLYVSPEFRRTLRPTVIGWRSDRGWRGVDNLQHGAPVFKTSAEKYEGANLPSALVYALSASVDMMLEIGPAVIERRVMELAACARERLRAVGARLLADEAPHFDSPIVAARFEGHDASALARELKSRRVLVAARHGNLRVSTHFYNNEDDIAQLETQLRALL
jgi:cysteine desulfurase / selenocysteine lyase